jgi:hypothetical protein
LATKQIYNCEEGSWAWQHEQGHLEYNKLDLAGRLLVYQDYALWIWMLSVTLSVLNHFMLVLSIPLILFYIGVEIYEEYWCNQFANMKIKVIDTNTKGLNNNEINNN